MPELPGEKRARYEKEYRLRTQDAFILTRSRKTAEYFESAINEMGATGDQPQKLANLIVNKKISMDMDIKSFCAKVKELLSPRETDNTLLAEAVARIVDANPKAVEDYRGGKQNALMFLLGQVMKEMRSKADATAVREALIKRLSS